MTMRTTENLSENGPYTHDAAAGRFLHDADPHHAGSDLPGAGTDSLRAGSDFADAVTDSLHVGNYSPDSMLYAAENEAFSTDGGWFTPDGVWHFGESVKEKAMSTADAVYGPFSSLAEPAAIPRAMVADAASPLTGSVFYDIAVLACFIVMCLILYFYRGYSTGIFNIFRGSAATEKMLGDQGKVFVAYLSRTIALGLFVAALVALKFIDLLFADRIPALSDLESLAVIIGIWIVASLIWGYMCVFLRIAGKLTLSREFTARLFFLKKITLAIWTITVTPLFLLIALSDGPVAQVIGIGIVTVTVFTSLFLLVRTFMLFIRHNFSILLWILYLCAVEIFPISFAAVAAGRFLV